MSALSPPLRPVAAAATIACSWRTQDEDDDLALLLDGIEDDSPLELDDEDDGNLFDVEAAGSCARAKPALTARRYSCQTCSGGAPVWTARPARAAARATPQVSDETCCGCRASPTRALKRPDYVPRRSRQPARRANRFVDEDEAAIDAELASVARRQRGALLLHIVIGQFAVGFCEQPVEGSSSRSVRSVCPAALCRPLALVRVRRQSRLQGDCVFVISSGASSVATNPIALRIRLSRSSREARMRALSKLLRGWRHARESSRSKLVAGAPR